jgi:Xaa-Pro aminopeptidase
VLEVQKDAIGAARPGAEYVELHLAAMRRTAELLTEVGILQGSVDELVERGAVSVFFPHGLGHLLGVDVHDMEDLGDRAGYEAGKARSNHPSLAALRLDRVLRPRMCVTIEPGFYQIPVLQRRARSDVKVANLIDWDRLGQFQDVRGIRIEDDVLISSGEAEVLSKSAPKEIREIEAVLEDR